MKKQDIPRKEHIAPSFIRVILYALMAITLVYITTLLFPQEQPTQEPETCAAPPKETPKNYTHEYKLMFMIGRCYERTGQTTLGCNPNETQCQCSDGTYLT